MQLVITIVFALGDKRTSTEKIRRVSQMWKKVDQNKFIKTLPENKFLVVIISKITEGYFLKVFCCDLNSYSEKDVEQAIQSRGLTNTDCKEEVVIAVSEYYNRFEWACKCDTLTDLFYELNSTTRFDMMLLADFNLE